MELYSPPLTRARARVTGKKLCIEPINKQVKVKTRAHEAMSQDVASVASAAPEDSDPTASCEIKKVKLSQDEMNMSGAPTGDIFDIKVLFDNELACLAQPESQVGVALLALKSETSTWAERYGAIEILRRSCVFSPAMFTSSIIESTIQALNEELDSLRSCTIRNSVFCLQGLLKLEVCQDWINSGEKCHVYDEIVGKLLLKSCSGPKFLCKIMLEVFVQGAKVLPFSRLTIVLDSFSSHKNSEVCNHVYAIGCENFLLNMNSVITENDGTTMETSIRLFQKGINSVQPAGRSMAKKALKGYADRIGAEAFSKEVNQYFSEDQCNEINREISKSSTTKSSSKARVPLRVLKSSHGTANRERSNVAEKSSVLSKGKAKPWETKKSNLSGGFGVTSVKISQISDSSTSSSFIL